MNPISMRSSWSRSTFSTSAHAIASSMRRKRQTPSSSMPRGSSVSGPHTLLPRGIEELGVCRFRRIEEAIAWADVLNVLRLQLERMEMGFIPSVREYYRVFGVTAERLEKAGRPITIMHPGPMNRGVEIDSRVADGPHSVILDQVTNGVAVRMAVLYLLAGGRAELADAAKRGSE